MQNSFLLLKTIYLLPKQLAFIKNNLLSSFSHCRLTANFHFLLSSVERSLELLKTFDESFTHLLNDSCQFSLTLVSSSFDRVYESLTKLSSKSGLSTLIQLSCSFKFDRASNKDESGCERLTRVAQQTENAKNSSALIEVLNTLKVDKIGGQREFNSH